MAKVQIKSERITPWGGIFSIIEQFRVNQQVQRYKIFLKKTSVGVEKLSFSIGLALIFLLILLIFPSVTLLMSVPLGMYCLMSLFPFSTAPSAMSSMSLQNKQVLPTSL